MPSTNVVLGNPYPGLRPFEYQDRANFFGREEQIQTLTSKLDNTRFVTVVGASGCGKSSLVRAGLLPRLEGNGGWQWLVMRPGARPMDVLTQALLEIDNRTQRGPATDNASFDLSKLEFMRTRALLLSSSNGLAEVIEENAQATKFLVIVDQFEEVFRFANQAGPAAWEEATRFVKLLIRAVQADLQQTCSVHIMLTTRLDFLGDCTRFSGLPEVINAGQFLVPRMNRQQRRIAIEQPALRAGREMSPTLVQQIIAEVGDDPDHLPVMQHALMRTWEVGQQPDYLDIDDYQAIGGMAQALSRHADEIYTGLAVDAAAEQDLQPIAARIFRCITAVDQDGRQTRAPQSLSKIAAMAEVDIALLSYVVQIFSLPGVNFLMPPYGSPLQPDTLIDISHEALIRNWHRLAEVKTGWLAQEQMDRRFYNDLVRGATAYAADNSCFLSSTVTRAGQLWWPTQNKPWANLFLTPGHWPAEAGEHYSAVDNLLQQSASHYAQVEKDRQQSQRQAQSLKTVKAVLVLLSLALLVVGGAGFYAWQAKSAETVARRAEQIANEAQKRRSDITSQQLTKILDQQEQEAVAAELSQQQIGAVNTALNTQVAALNLQLKTLQIEVGGNASTDQKLQAIIDSKNRTIASLKAQIRTLKQPVINPKKPAQADYAAGDTFADCSFCPAMVVIPAGVFRMGSEKDEAGREENEGPAHKVTIEAPFALGRFEVTFEEYDAFALAEGKKLPADRGWGRAKRPVINVSGLDAAAYVKWLSTKTGEAYYLPREAQWEYAARAGTQTRYSWGDAPSGKHANGDERYGWPKDGFNNQTAPVGSFIANNFGLFDMHGNVWEWVADCWHSSYKGAPDDESAWPTDKGACARQVLRGGGWFNRPANLRSANRDRDDTVEASIRVGFRVARAL